ncbi:TraR/DksA C4-type zinc finger protein [Notoacmeibacter sp. MSK16QG-6]|uniref:TraR/DksA family transcriptional regulator n=1 Tax=Notoacmeibacter sp. MSK16QG-6 TaxID=2957982 RepID=UPI0020A108A9|nr:TraR/DksA C4-type zinc finger protein [Notoacmeibacter sp. MSK16QG-6]MCP1199820.1 TraR/DksA C4-type zinc finger protein [Notoacmeibacter sp. MSK16QG-6]
MPNQAAAAAAETILRNRKRELEARLSDIDAAFSQPAPADSEEAAIEAEDDEVQIELGVTGETELKAIDAALHRIEIGIYGTCLHCENPIDKKRLELIPWTPFCRSCAQTL